MSKYIEFCSYLHDCCHVTLISLALFVEFPGVFSPSDVLVRSLLGGHWLPSPVQFVVHLTSHRLYSHCTVTVLYTPRRFVFISIISFLIACHISILPSSVETFIWAFLLEWSALAALGVPCFVISVFNPSQRDTETGVFFVVGILIFVE